MHYTLQGKSLYQAFNALQLALADEQKNQGTPTKNDFTLNVVNAAWGQSGCKFLQDYLDILDEYYGAGMRTVDFEADPEGARQTINDWVNVGIEVTLKIDRPFIFVIQDNQSGTILFVGRVVSL